MSNDSRTNRSHLAFVISCLIFFLLSSSSTFAQPNTNVTTLPKWTFGVQPIFISAPNDAPDFFGGDVHAHFYGRGFASVDTDYVYDPSDWHTQFGGGVNVFVAFASEDEFKFTLSGITAGPEVRFSKNSFSGVIFLQGGMIKDQIKFGDNKDHESNFGIRTGITLDWWLSDKFALSLSPQTVTTKSEDKTDWNAAVGFGAIFKISRAYGQ